MKFALPSPSAPRPGMVGPVGREAPPPPFDHPQAYRFAPPPASGGLIDYGRLFARHKWLLAGCALAGLAAGLLLKNMQTPVYRARASIQVDDLNDNVLGKRDLERAAESTGADSYLQTQIKLMQSDSLMEGVLKSLGFPERQVTPESVGLVTTLKRKLNLLPTAPPSLDADIVLFQSHLKVKSPDQTRIIEVTFDWPQREFAAEFTNAFVSRFGQHTLDVRADEAESTARWLQTQIVSLRENVERSEGALQAYMNQSGLIIAGEKDNLGEDSLKQVQTEYARSQADRIIKESQYDLASSQPATSLPEVLDNGPIRDFQVKLADLQRQYAQLGETLTPSHYKMRQLKAESDQLKSTIDQERTNIVRRIQNDYDAAQKREHLLRQQYAGEVSRMARQSTQLGRYNALKREADTNRQVYEAMLQKVKEYGIVAALPGSNIRIVDKARLPRSPVRPILVWYLALGTMSGVAFAGALVLFREHGDTVFREPGEIARKLSTTELGFIPKAPRWEIESDLDKASGVLRLGESAVQRFGICLPWRRKPSMRAESFRIVLGSIILAIGKNDSFRTIVVASPKSGEGKTTVTSNLAIAIAEVGQSVLVIDADIRKPTVHTIFGVENENGLFDVLKSPPLDEASVTKAIKETKIPNLSVLTAGQPREKLSAILYSMEWQRLLDSVRHRYDAVLIDTPPLLLFPEARGWGRVADGVVLVVRANHTLLEQAEAARDKLREDNTPLLGTVLNDWVPNNGNSHYEAYAGYPNVFA